MSQVEAHTNEGVSGEDDELLQWLKENRLLKSKKEFIENDVTLDDLKAIDLQLDLNDFISKDLKLHGIAATKARKAIINLHKQPSVYNKPPQKQIVRIVLSKEEDDAMNAISAKQNEISNYLQTLSNDITILNNILHQNEKALNEFEKDIKNKIEIRINELKQKSKQEINIKQKQIETHMNAMKECESSLKNAESLCNKLLNDTSLDKSNRKTQILQIHQKINDNSLKNKLKYNPKVDVEINKNKIYDTIKHMGYINKYNYPNAPQCFVTDIKVTSAVVEFIKIDASLEYAVEIRDGSAENKFDDDEKQLNWSQLEKFKNESRYLCSNLDSDKQYDLRTKCKNYYGWSPYSKVISFKTKKQTLAIVSSILTENEKNIFVDLLIKGNKNIKSFQLLYRGTRDGYTYGSWKSRCYNKGKTITIVETTTNNVFGAFTSKPFGGHNRSCADNTAFLFLLRSSKQHKPQIFNVVPNNSYAVHGGRYDYFVVFGKGHDIYVPVDCASGANSWTQKGSYDLPSKHYLNAGVKKFQVKELEVFKVE